VHTIVNTIIIFNVLLKYGIGKLTITNLNC